jgi:hypothetical protein
VIVIIELAVHITGGREILQSHNFVQFYPQKNIIEQKKSTPSNNNFTVELCLLLATAKTCTAATVSNEKHSEIQSILMSA